MFNTELITLISQTITSAILCSIAFSLVVAFFRER